MRPTDPFSKIYVGTTLALEGMAELAFVLFAFLALPAVAIADGVDSTTTQDSLTRTLNLAADGGIGASTLVEWWGLSKMADAQEAKRKLTDEENATICAGLIIIAAIFVITCLQEADTSLQPSPDPNMGDEFHEGGTKLEAIDHSVLRQATPGAGQWSGQVADAVTDQTDAQRLRLQQMTQADTRVAGILQTQADEVTQARRWVAGARLTLSAAIPGAAVLYKLDPWASVLWQFSMCVAAIAEVVIAYLRLGRKSQQNAKEINDVTAIYREVHQSAAAAVSPGPALTATSPPAASANLDVDTSGAAGWTFGTATQQAGLPFKPQLAPAAETLLPAGTRVGQTLGQTAQLARPAARKKAATEETTPAPDVDSAGAGAAEGIQHAEGVPADLTAAEAATAEAPEASRPRWPHTSTSRAAH